MSRRPDAEPDQSPAAWFRACATPLASGLLAELAGEFPEFKVRRKADSRLCHGIDRALWILTFGKQRSFLTTYYTVLGFTLFVPDSWASLGDEDRVILLRHERVHLRQRRRYTFLGMAFLYLLPLFPVGLALGRARIEWEAYTETLRATAELRGLDAARALRPQLLERFTGPDYAWMWPFPSTVDRWYDRVIAEIEAEQKLQVGPLAQPGTSRVLNRKHP